MKTLNLNTNAVTVAFLAFTMATLNLRGSEDPKMVPLFDGKTLKDWKTHGGKATYRIENGMIVGMTVEGSPNTFLCTARNYADFVLEFDVLCDKELNSGVQIRSHVYEKDSPQPSQPARIRKAGEVFGYQCEIASQDRGTAGNFWDEARHTRWFDDFAMKPEAKKAFKDGEWNHYRIVAQGDHIRSWVNGVSCADFRDTTDDRALSACRSTPSSRAQALSRSAGRTSKSVS
jgi:hypothetical protein